MAGGVEANLGERLRSVRPLGGGCIGEVYMAELEDGTPLVAKVDRAGEAHLDREAYMLRYLRERTGLPVPEVFHGSETLLLMEFVEGNNRFSRGAERHAAELLAALHGVTADAYGHERDTLIGSLDQPNPWTGDWVGFFRERRLLYAARVAHEAGRLPAEDLGRVERLAERLGDLIGETNPPALIHGDAWRGNVLAKELYPALRPRVWLVEAADKRIPLVAVGAGRDAVQRREELGGVLLCPLREAAATLDELHQEERLGAVVDLGDGELAVLAEVAKHVSLAFQVRLALPVQLRDERRAVGELYPVDLADAAAAHRPGAPQPFAEVLLYPSGEEPFSHRAGGPCAGGSNRYTRTDVGALLRRALHH